MRTIYYLVEDLGKGKFPKLWGLVYCANSAEWGQELPSLILFNHPQPEKLRVEVLGRFKLAILLDDKDLLKEPLGELEIRTSLAPEPEAVVRP